MAKEEWLQRDVKVWMVGHQQGMQLKGEIIPCWRTHNRNGPLLHNSFMTGEIHLGVEPRKPPKYANDEGDKWLTSSYVKAKKVKVLAPQMHDCLLDLASSFSYIHSRLYLGAIHLWCPHGRGQAQVDSCRRVGEAQCGRTHRKLEPTEVILSSYHAKKLAFLDQNFSYVRNKKQTFFVNIN